jgi:YHS domain-containing protein
VRDRVCNTFVPRASALRAQLGGHEEYFCSAACRDKALALLKAS